MLPKLYIYIYIYYQRLVMNETNVHNIFSMIYQRLIGLNSLAFIFLK